MPPPCDPLEFAPCLLHILSMPIHCESTDGQAVFLWWMWMRATWSLLCGSSPYSCGSPSSVCLFICLFVCVFLLLSFSHSLKADPLWAVFLWWMRASSMITPPQLLPIFMWESFFCPPTFSWKFLHTLIFGKSQITSRTQAVQYDDSTCIFPASTFGWFSRSSRGLEFWIVIGGLFWIGLILRAPFDGITLGESLGLLWALWSCGNPLHILGHAAGQRVAIWTHLYQNRIQIVLWWMGGIFILHTWALWSLLWESSTMESLHIPNRAVGQRAAIQPYLWPDCGYCWYWRRQRADALALLIIIGIFDQPTPAQHFLHVSQCAICNVGSSIELCFLFSHIQFY